MHIPRFALSSFWIASLVCGITLAACTPGGGGPTLGIAPTASTSPTPSPGGASASPTPSPSGAITPSQTSVTFSGSGAQTLSITEAGYNGSFTAVSANPSVVTASVATTSASARRRDDTSAVITLTPVGGGSTIVTVSDTLGHATSIPITVTSAVFVPEVRQGDNSR